MTGLETELQILVTERFKQALANTNLEIRTEDKWQTSILKRYFDIVIYKGFNPIAVIEVKNRLVNKNLLAIATDQVRSALSITNARFGIVTDNEVFYFYDRNEKDKDFWLEGFENIV